MYNINWGAEICILRTLWLACSRIVIIIYYLWSVTEHVQGEPSYSLVGTLKKICGWSLVDSFVLYRADIKASSKYKVLLDTKDSCWLEAGSSSQQHCVVVLVIHFTMWQAIKPEFYLYLYCPESLSTAKTWTLNLKSICHLVGWWG